jgi:putative drug exporter of the RND superfamily
MRSFLSPPAWARRSAAHPWRVIGAWGAAFVVALVVMGALLSGVLTSDTTFTRNPESQRARDTIQKQVGAGDAVVEQVVVQTGSGTFRDPGPRAAVRSMASDLRALGPAIVASVGTPFSAAQGAPVSRDRTTTVIPMTMTGDLATANDNVHRVLDTTKAYQGRDGLSVRVAGQASINHDVNKTASKDLEKGEAFGIPIALIILLLVFGAVVSALLPVILAIVAIVIALALTSLVGQIGDLSFFVTNMITMMGLAVGIDYALFIVSRYREERAGGREKLHAIERAGDTASRAVFFSGLTVVVALIGLLIVPMSVFISLAVGAILVVLSAVAAAQTLLPALLSVLGDRIETGRLSRLVPTRMRRERTGPGFWPRVVGGVMRRPWLSLISAAGLLIIAAVPYFGINTGASGVESLPPNLQSRQGFEILQREFSVGGIAPARIPVVGDPASAGNRAEIQRITRDVAGDPVLGTPHLTHVSSRGAVLEVPVNAEASSSSAQDAVKRLRAVSDLPVGGQTAENIDYFAIADGYLPIVVLVVLALSFLVLLLAFRSIVVPLVAIAMNLLSVGAAFGILTLVSQEGVGASILGFQQVDTVEAWIPLFLFSVLFGLSMDYHVFLISRIRERYRRTGDNVDAITWGISSSARLITGAALIMVAVFFGFASGDLVMFQQMGFGLGVAVLLDATLVRGVLVPATMRLLGDWNWYLPRSLAWLPHLSVEGEAASARAAAA